MKCASILWRAIKVFSAFLSIGCASVPSHDPFYNGEPLVPSSDSTTFLRIKIVNLRTVDANPPHIYLRGSGVHALGVLLGMDGKIDRLIDASWLGPDGCASIIAHFVAVGDLVFTRVCWHQGEMIEATLVDHFDANTAWSHR